MEKNKHLMKQAAGCLAGLAIVLALESFTGLDIWLEDRFFSFASGTWLISKAFHDQWGLWLYSFPKFLLIIFALCNLGVLVYSWKSGKYVQWRKNACKIILALIIIPSVIGGLKATTNVYCPYQIERYGGAYPYVPILRHYPAGFVQMDRGRGFPAGHASGGLSLMVLYFCFAEERRRRLALAVGLGVGWYMGIYQMLRGEHFLSHTLFSTFLAWLMILAINKLVEEPELLTSWSKKLDMTDLPREQVEN